MEIMWELGTKRRAWVMKGPFPTHSQLPLSNRLLLLLCLLSVNPPQSFSDCLIGSTVPQSCTYHTPPFYIRILYPPLPLNRDLSYVTGPTSGSSQQCLAQSRLSTFHLLMWDVTLSLQSRKPGVWVNVVAQIYNPSTW